MKGKTRVQAMPKRRAKGAAQDTHITPGKAGPRGALVEAGGKPPRSGPSGAEGNNTRRDFTRLGARTRRAARRSTRPS
jgi:hypothetical protein